MKKIIALVLVALMVLAAFTGCTTNNNTESAEKNKNELNVCLASEPATIDPALNSAVDGASLCAHLFSGLSKWAQDESGNLVIKADCAEKLVDGVVNEDGTVTYTYTLREGLKWSDGKDLKASDFEYAWKRAASTALGADYGYMFEVVKGYGEDDVDGLAPLAVSSDDEKRTITITISNAISYWDELLAFPTYFPVRKDVVADEKWATDPATYIGNGPYKMTAWTHNSVITMEKNEYYIDADTVTMPKINFYLSDDNSAMLANYNAGTWDMIDDVPVDEIEALKSQDDFIVAGQIGTYYVCFNVNFDLLPGSTLTGVEKEQAQAEIRKALTTVIDRNYIVENITKTGQVPASSFVAMGMTNPDGTEFYQTANGGKTETKNYYGYYDTSKEAYESNAKSAQAVLDKYYKDAGISVPAMTYLYNTNDTHKQIGEALQSTLSQYGFDMQLVNQEWNTFLETRKQGDYTIARNGWVADYTDPICFLDMWTTNSGNNDVQFGKGAHAELKMYSIDLTNYGGEKVENGTWAETYDVLIAKIKSETDTTKRYELMHMAEDLLMSTGCIVPIYFYTDLYMIKDNVKGFYSSPLGYKYFQNTTIVD